MKTYHIITIVLLTLSLFSACTTDQEADVTKPVIELFEPEEGAELRIGSVKGIHFEMDLSDNEMLRSYKVEIHNNFDGHSHGSAATRTFNQETVAFAYNRSYDVSGLRNTHIHHHDILIPENTTPGKYHLIVYCTDESGNESYVARNILLSTTAEEDTEE